jgi:hypothetical protein
LGIKTEMPQTELDIRGSVTAFDFSGDGNSLTNLNMDNAGSGTLSVDRGGTGRFSLDAGKLLVGDGVQGVVSPADLHWDAGSARLGVRTSNPEATLDVRGSLFATSFGTEDGSGISNLDMDNAGLGVLSVQRGGTGNSGLPEAKLIVGGGASNPVESLDELHWDAGNRRLGVHTDAPQTEVDVIGTVRSTFFAGNGSGITDLDMDNAASGVLDVVHGGTGLSDVPADKLVVGRGGSALAAPSELHWTDATKRMGVLTDTPATTLDVRGDVTAFVFYGDGSGLSNLNASAVGSGVLDVANGGTGTDSHADSKLLVGRGVDAVDSPADLHWDEVNQRLGVRVTSPQTTLHVAGTVRSTSIEADGNALTNLNANALTTGTTVVARGGTGASSLAAAKLLVGNGTGAVLTPATLHWDATNQRLGVGRTAPPEHSLDVSGSVRASGQVLGNEQDSAQAPSHSWSDDADTGIFHPAANALAFSTGGTERARLTSAGRLGLGTLAPAARLHVVGNLVLDGTLTQGSMSTDRLTQGILPVERGGTGVDAHEENKLVMGDGSNALISVSGLHWDASNAYLGIGTATPQTKADVRGTLRAFSLEGEGSGVTSLNAGNVTSGTLSVPRGGMGSAAHSYGKFLIGRNTDPVLSAESLHWNEALGRMGLGTSNPQTALDVSGTVTATAFDGDGSDIRELDADNITSGILDVVHGGTGVGFHSESKVMIGRGSNALEAAADLHWDASSNRLGIGRDDPRGALDAVGTV